MPEALTIYYPVLLCGHVPMYCADNTDHAPHDWPADWPFVGGTYHCYGIGAPARSDPDGCPRAIARRNKTGKITRRRTNRDERRARARDLTVRRRQIKRRDRHDFRRTVRHYIGA